MSPFKELGWPEMEAAHIASIPEPMRGLLIELLLHKALFVGEWFKATSHEWEEARATLASIRHETLIQAEQAISLMALWSEHPNAHDAATEAAKVTRQRLLENLIGLKKGSTEVFLSAGMRAPTNELRREFVRLADLDREHAEQLRRLLMLYPPARPRREAEENVPTLGAAIRQPGAGSLRHQVERDAARLRDGDGVFCASS